MENLTQSIKRPFTHFWRLIIGIILSIVPIINLFATGYELRCARTAMTKKLELPKWDKFWELFSTGFLSAIITFIYIIPAIIIFVSIAAGSLSELATNLVSGQEFNIMDYFSGASVSLLVIGVVLLILGGYLGMSAIIKYAQRLKFGDAFSGDIFRKAFTGKFFATWVILLIYVAVISMILNFIPFIGAAIASFIGGVSYMTALGLIYKKL